MINITAERRSVKAETQLPSAVVFDLPSVNILVSSHCVGVAMTTVWLRAGRPV